MSKAVKNLLLVFTLVCAIALVAFSVELFTANRNAGDRQPGGSVSESSPGGSGGSSAKPEASPSGQTPPPTEGTTSPEKTEPTDTPPPAPTGKRFELSLLPNMKLILYADEDLFKNIKQQDFELFEYTGGGAASLEIGYYFIPPQGVSAAAVGFLDGYLDGGTSNAGGDGMIKRSPLNGYFISGVKGLETYEAWLHHPENNDIEDLGIYFVIHYSNTEQRNSLYKVLDTLELIKV